MSCPNADLDSLQPCTGSAFLLQMLCPPTLLSLTISVFMPGHRRRVTLATSLTVWRSSWFFLISLTLERLTHSDAHRFTTFLLILRKMIFFPWIKLSLSLKMYPRNIFKESLPLEYQYKVIRTDIFLKWVFVSFSYLHEIPPRIYMWKWVMRNSVFTQMISSPGSHAYSQETETQ